MEPENSLPRVSMREIAARLGVSHVTVSMALRDNPRVSLATREKIKKAAEEWGYRRDPLLSALATYRKSKTTTTIHSVVAWINAWERPDELRGYKEFDSYWKGASQAAEKFGYRLEEFRIDKTMTTFRLHRIFQTRGIRGILLPPHGPYQPAWEDFPWSDYSVARFGRSLKHPAAHLVTADQLTNTFVAVEKMIERGYKRIGLITFETDLDPRGPHFTAGFLSARALLHDVDALPMFCIKEPVTAETIDSFRAWMAEQKPDALLSTVEQKILLQKAGYRVPEDVAVAVTSVLDGGADSGMDQHPEEIGRVGFLLLNSLLNDSARGIPTIFRQILVQGSWVDGKSLPDRRRPS
ncbi:LacI family DNA-binding transcriptional regulator [Luteolibacter sp. LG18]|uniref:LacI family DNA-binding transcriptional regulator n=1 Tax=Luteolibacter sp. LG18 TaxID=2819286 RepID=UPI002B2F9CB0|nr:LacI family transcriptional regulator [Luteolibacter sp. LG18]